MTGSLTEDRDGESQLNLGRQGRTNWYQHPEGSGWGTVKGRRE